MKLFSPKMLTTLLAAVLTLYCFSGCTEITRNETSNASVASKPQTEDLDRQTGLVTEQILNSEIGEIHYSYYLPDNYSDSREYPMMVVMPGYDMMWFGEDSSGSNLNWNGFRCWMGLDEEMIVVSAQLTDWGETSAREAVELTEYFIDSFSVDTNRIYAAGYSAGGETMSRAVSMRLICTRPICMGPPNGMENLPPLRNIMWPIISSWQRMTNIMVHSGPEMLIMVFMKRMKTWAGLTMK